MMAIIPIDILNKSSTSMMSLIALVMLVVPVFAQNETQFIYNGFEGSINKPLHLNGLANIFPNGLLQMNNHSNNYNGSGAFHPSPVMFRPKHKSFSTTFVFAMYPRIPNYLDNGFAFVISPTTDFQYATYLGIFDTKQSNHIVAVQLSTIEESGATASEIGISINSPNSAVNAVSASYYSDEQGVNKTLMLNSGKPVQLWIDYDEAEMLINVTLAPLGLPKPSKCLSSKQNNLSTVLLDSMYVGFSSSTDQGSNSHYILGWSWNQNGKAQELDLSKLPSLPQIKHKKQLKLSQSSFALLLVVALLLLIMIAATFWFLWRNKYQEEHEPWEKEYAPNRLSYKDLFVATKGFKNSELLGVGGFGKVYKGVLPCTSAQVAVKRIAHDSKQGMKEFVAEISCMRRLRHRNLIQILGYCRRKGELLLVYEYMPNGSLDKFLFAKAEKPNLSWSLRFNIIKGVASSLLYLHEEWEQVVLHRDVKASNVLLDAEMNAKLGDFGLARLYDHNINPRTTRVAGTIGYIAPEASRTRKASTSTDIFAFGMFLLEVSCGRRPTGKQDDDDEAKALFLSDWVYECWKRGEILKAADSRIRMEGDHHQKREMELVLKLGLLCLHPKAEARPKTRLVVQILNGSAMLPDILLSEYNPETNDYFGEDLEAFCLLPLSTGTICHGVMSSTNSVLQYGR